MTMVFSSKLSTSSTPDTDRRSRSSRIRWWATSGRPRSLSYGMTMPLSHIVLSLLYGTGAWDMSHAMAFAITGASRRLRTRARASLRASGMRKGMTQLHRADTTPMGPLVAAYIRTNQAVPKA